MPFSESGCHAASSDSSSTAWPPAFVVFALTEAMGTELRVHTVIVDECGAGMDWSRA